MIRIRRRAFLVASGATMAAAALPVIPAFAKDYKEAPFFKDQVAKKAIPALAERLPENPLVITPKDEDGKYGGDWKLALVRGGGLSMVFR